MHWIERFRRGYCRKDGGTGLSQDELAELVRKCRIDKRNVGCSGKLIDILERGGITAPGIAAMITKVCGGTAENWDSIVHEDYRGQWKPGQKINFKPRFEELPDEYTILTAEEWDAMDEKQRAEEVKRARKLKEKKVEA